MNKLFRLSTFALLLCLFLCPPLLERANANTNLRTYLSIEIDMPRTTYKPGERLEGEIIIRNSSPATLPGNFRVSLYKNDILEFSATTFVQTLFSGRTDLRFRSFGIPQLKNNNSAKGHWTLAIHQVNRPHESVAIDFHVK